MAIGKARRSEMATCIVALSIWVSLSNFDSRSQLGDPETHV